MRNLFFAKELINGMDIIEINKSISEEARKIYVSLKKINKLIPLADLFIAATAVYCKIPIVTLNKKHFEFVQEIIIL